MLTLEEYKEFFPDVFVIHESHLKNESIYYPRLIILGMLEISNKPSKYVATDLFEGNYAGVTLSDFSETISWQLKRKNNSEIKLIHFNDQKKKEIEDYYKRSIYPVKKYSKIVNYPTSEFPFRLHFFGSHNTSFIKFYESEKTAKEELDLFIGNQPLDLFEIIKDFNFLRED